MSKNTKNKITTLLIILSVLQGPIFFYFTEGLLKVLLLIPYALFGLLSSLYLLFFIIRHRSTTTKYHVIGLFTAVTIGLLLVRGNLMEKIDFTLRKRQRLEIVKKLKSGKIKPGDPYYKQWFINKNDKGIVSVEFYIDHGFIDHYSTFLYTNDPQEIKRLSKNETGAIYGTVKKIEDNWYLIRF
jgi:hypothetical protein